VVKLGRLKSHTVLNIKMLSEKYSHHWIWKKRSRKRSRRRIPGILGRRGVNLVMLVDLFFPRKLSQIYSSYLCDFVNKSKG
jgi:hypothetical protein